MQRTKVIMAIILIGLFSAGWLGGNVLISNGNDASAAALVQLAKAGMDKIKAQLDSGGVLHLGHQTFQRYGPAAELIAELPWALPEMSYSDQWLGADETGNFSSYQAHVTDNTGKIIQESALVDGVLVSVNASDSKQVRVGYEVISIDEFLQYAAERASRLTDQGWQVVGRGIWNGEETVILEMRSHYPQAIPSPSEGNSNSISFSGENDSQDSTSMAPESPASSLGITESGYLSIPYVDDLKPHEAIHRIEIILDNPLWTREQMIVVDEEGRESLVLESKTTTVEVIHQDEEETPDS